MLMSWSPSSPFTFSTGDTVPVQSVATFFLIDQRTWLIIVIIIIMVIIIKRIFAKDYLRNSLVKSRIALASPGCSFGWLVVCHHAKNNQMYTEKMVVDCPLVIISKVKPFSRPEHIRKKRNNWSIHQLWH